MKTLKNLRSCIVGSTILTTSLAQGAILFSDNFEADHTASWTVNKSTGANANNAGSFANFFYDYSTVGIPSAPNSGGTTRGLQMRANVTGGIFSGLSVSPTGQSFSGNYQLRFDMWINYNGPLNGSGSGTTQVTGAGIGTSGTTAQWANSIQDSIWFAATGDGGSGLADYRAYSSAASSGYPDASPVFAAGPHLGNRNNLDPYYAGFGGATAPAAQVTAYPQQTGTTPTGTPAFAWRDVIILKMGNTVTWTVDGLLIATVDASTVSLGGSDILFNYFDTTAGSSADPNAAALLFGLIDNVTVSAVPEPSTYIAGALLLLPFGVSTLRMLRKCRAA